MTTATDSGLESHWDLPNLPARIGGTKHHLERPTESAIEHPEIKKIFASHRAHRAEISDIDARSSA